MTSRALSLTGIPWKVGGRDRGGVDCLGLALLAQRELFGRIIEDVWHYGESTYQAVSLTAPVDLLMLGAVEVPQPLDGDVAFLLLRGYGHLSTVVGEGLLTIFEGSRSLWRKPGRTLPFRYFRFGEGEVEWESVR